MVITKKKCLKENNLIKKLKTMMQVLPKEKEKKMTSPRESKKA